MVDISQLVEFAVQELGFIIDVCDRDGFLLVNPHPEDVFSKKHQTYRLAMQSLGWTLARGLQGETCPQGIGLLARAGWIEATWDDMGILWVIRPTERGRQVWEEYVLAHASETV